MGEFLSKKVVTVRAMAPQAAGTSDTLTSSNVLCAGYGAFRVIVGFGAIVSGAVTTFKVQHSDTTTDGDFSDISGSAISVADTADNTLIISDWIRTAKKYVRFKITRATQNATIDLGLVELYEPNSLPVTQDATVSTLETAAFPTNGTA